MLQPERPEQGQALTADLVQRIRESCCDEPGSRVDLDDHAERVAKEVARAREARQALAIRRPTYP